MITKILYIYIVSIIPDASPTAVQFQCTACIMETDKPVQRYNMQPQISVITRLGIYKTPIALNTELANAVKSDLFTAHGQSGFDYTYLIGGFNIL